MNNLAFVVRGPLLLALMSIFGLHYLVANVLSLCALTIARFALADAWIWGSGTATRAFYDIHSLATIDSEVVLPELARFRVAGLSGPPSIRVEIAPLRQDRATQLLARASTAPRSSPTASPCPAGSRCASSSASASLISASPLVRRSPHVLYTNCVEPVLRWHLRRARRRARACRVRRRRRSRVPDHGAHRHRQDHHDPEAARHLPAGLVHLRRPHARRAGRVGRVVSQAAHDQPAHAACRDALRA